MAFGALCWALSIAVGESFIIPASTASHSTNQVNSSLWLAQELLLERKLKQNEKTITTIRPKHRARRKQSSVNVALSATAASPNPNNYNYGNKNINRNATNRQKPSETHSILLPPMELLQKENNYDDELSPMHEKHTVSKSTKAHQKKFNNKALYDRSRTVPDSMKQFVSEIHREDRITRSEEIALGEKTQEAVRLTNIYDQLKEKLQREPSDEEWCAASGKINMEAISQAIDDGLSAKNKLVTSNLRMVQSVVNTYLRNGLAAHYNAGDLMQEGILALIRAAEKFEPNRGFKFSTYAMYWVRASVKRSQVSQSRIISIPQRLYTDSKKLRRMEAELYTLTGTKPSNYELAVAAGMKEDYVNRCLSAIKLKMQSIDHGLTNSKKGFRESGQDDSLTLLIADEETECAEDFIARQDMMRCLQRHLTTEQFMLLLLRFGVVGSSPATIAELSDLVGETPDRVRRRIKHSLLQLKEAGIDDEWMSFGKELPI